MVVMMMVMMVMIKEIRSKLVQSTPYENNERQLRKQKEKK